MTEELLVSAKRLRAGGTPLSPPYPVGGKRA